MAEGSVQPRSGAQAGGVVGRADSGPVSAQAAESAINRSTSRVQAAGLLGLTVPLTERVLRRLGSPRWLWITLWASTAIAAPAVLLTILDVSGESKRVTSISGLLISQEVLAYAVLLALWGVGRLIREARGLEPHLIRLMSSERPIYPSTGTLAVPLLLTTLVSIVNTAGSWVRYGPWPTIAALPLLFIGLLAIMTYVWTYLQLLIGIDRLGRTRLDLDLFPQDRTLGLRAVGSLAFTGFVILFAAAIPILVTTSANLSTVVLSVGLVGVSVSMFFLSMWRVHRQMAAAKAGFVAETHALYAQVYAPLRTTPTADALAAQAPALGAAQALVERAERILEWPVDEGTTAWVAIIVTGVVTSLIVRLVFGAAGL